MKIDCLLQDYPNGFFPFVLLYQESFHFVVDLDILLKFNQHFIDYNSKNC